MSKCNSNRSSNNNCKNNKHKYTMCIESLTCALLIVCAVLPFPAQASIIDKLREDADLSQFYSLLLQNPIANTTLQLRRCTLFVPTNDVFQRHRGPTNVLYHMVTVDMEKDQLPKILHTETDSHDTLYITKNRNGDIYVNNARIIPSLSTSMTNSLGIRQVMHVIDEILVPLTLLPSVQTELNSPDAYTFLKQSDLFDIGEKNRLRTYRNQVNVAHKDNIYRAPGAHTFFIPIDEGFKIATRSSLVDSKVIDGHVIPNNVVFTSPGLDSPLTTAAFEDNIKVTATIYKEKDGKLNVRSSTISGDGKHTVGTVIAQIAKANIPVSNGVVHLIRRPLMISDTTVAQFLKAFELPWDRQESENGPLRNFIEAIMDIGGEVIDELNGLGDITILAPSNDAWNMSAVKNVQRNREKMRDILNMHIIKDRLNVERIRQSNQHMIPTVNNRTFLYFNVNDEGTEPRITVEGGGVNATIITADVTQTNGYVHIIDRVLGIPYKTVLGKLEEYPMMSDTFKLGQYSSFNSQLNDTTRRFTYFVPSNSGWERSAMKMPSAHKKLFMRDFNYHSKAILERHLVIADRVFTMNDLVAMTIESNSIVLPTYRDSLKLNVVMEPGHYAINWNNIEISVIRGDIECTNGIIHVIDYPMLEEKDIVVSGGSYALQSNHCILFANFIMLAIAKFLI